MNQLHIIAQFKATCDHVLVITFAFILHLQTGTTALFFAAQGGYMDIAGLLLEHGAIVDSCSIVSRGGGVLSACVNPISMLLNANFPTWISGRRHAALRRMPVRSSGRRGGFNRERRQSERSYEGNNTLSISIPLTISSSIILLVYPAEGVWTFGSTSNILVQLFH